MTTLLVLGARMAQLPLIRAAREDGLRVVTVDPDPGAPGHSIADHAHIHDLADSAACLEVARHYPVDGVVTLGADFPMPVLAGICDSLKLTGPDPDAVRRATDKALMRAALGGPAHHRVADPEAAFAAVRALDGDAIVKPVLSSGGRGVTLLPAGAGEDAIARAFAQAAEKSRDRHAIVESFVEGPEFSVETITMGGRTTVLAITDKETAGPPHFVEIAHRQPTATSGTDRRALIRAAVQGIAALGIDNAPGHSEIRLSGEGPVIIEIAARMGGGFIASHLTPLATGVDMVRAAIALALGRTPDLSNGPERGAASRFLCPPPGRVRAVSGLDAVRADPACADAALYVGPGDTVSALVDATGRAGHVIATAADGAAAAAAATRLADLIWFDTAPT